VSGAGGTLQAMATKPSNVTPLNAAFRSDGWASAITGIGKSLYDKRLWSDFEAHELTLQEIEELWAGDDMAARIVELVPDECLRQGFELQIEGDEDGQAEAVTAFLDEVDVIGHLREAMCYARAYGGGAILLGADDGQQSAKPLNLATVRSLGWMMVLSPRELEVATRYADPWLPKFGEPETFHIRNNTTDTAAQRFAAKPVIHETRLIRFSGPRVSRRRQIQAGGWGESVLTRCWQIVRDFQNAWQGAALLLGEVGQLVLKIKGLAELLSMPDGETAVVKRAQMIEQARSICRAVITDAEDTFERIPVELAGVDTMLEQFSHRLAAAARIPVTLLMGQAPAGLNATGESDVRWFYDTVAAEQKRVLLPGLNRLLEVIFNAKAGPTNGKEPENWTVRFNAPWQLTEAEQVDVRFKQAQADSLYIREGVLTPEEVASSRFGGDAYSIETKLDLEARAAFEAELAAAESAPAAEGEGMMEEAADVQTGTREATPPPTARVRR
jgi:phage-related protein (TIGR01555 family)